MTETALDSFDRALLAEMQRDAAQTHAQLAHRVNLSESSVRRRLARLRTEFIIAREVALLSTDRLGFTVIVGMRCTEESDDSYARLKARWADCPSISQVYNVSGEADFILVTHHVDMPAYKAWLDAYVIGDPDVERCDSSFAFETVKFDTAIPL
ncbi:Lrp/AsnC family transcriptional regulator [Sphingomicrobium arenosum]|uniref:Lrp/AsnC family transcriptional regulator n=1 Tax=Sphingomicrobium arenosum TaxID=2233861 RepID=UPI002240F829|nr:Lrp/AsnC family transcriptional regulator [Sphingomicrobium arenosum]